MPQSGPEPQPSLEDWWATPPDQAAALVQEVREAAPEEVSRTRMFTSRASVSRGNAEPETLLDFPEEPPAAAPPRPAPQPAAPPAPAMTEGPVVDPEPVLAASFRAGSVDDLAPASARAKIQANLQALEVLREVQAEQRPATPEEQATLARWSGWGATGVAQVFEDRPEYAETQARLLEVLSEDEYLAAARTTLNAHYTDHRLVTAVWDAVTALGFDGGRVLEPGSGSGTFIGAAPPSAQMTGVELDPTTAAISQLLYPAATVRAESFAETRFPSGYFDAAVGNVPFGNVTLHDPRYNPRRFSLHNHFISKSLEMTRPGGVVAVLTSRYSMDAQNADARQDWAARADLLGAVRLPSGAHERTAGTEAVTDVLVFRRRLEGEAPLSDDWTRTQTTAFDGPDGPVAQVINAYWDQHPENVLGTHVVDQGDKGRWELKVQGDAAAAHEQLHGALERIVEAARTQGRTMPARAPEDELPDVTDWLGSGDEVVDGRVVKKDGAYWQVVDGGLSPVKVAKANHAEVDALLRLRDQAADVVAREGVAAEGDLELEAAREELRENWTAYRDRYGPISRVTVHETSRTDRDGRPVVQRRFPAAPRLLRSDPQGPLLWGLEVYDAPTGTAEPASLLLQRMVVPRRPVVSVENAVDGLAVVLDTRGRVDLEEIARLRGADSTDQVISELRGRIFEAPDRAGEWITRAEYCSGNVREKLEVARARAADDPARWADHVAALEEVMPADLQAGDVTARIGAAWISELDHGAFLRETLGISTGRVTHIGGPHGGWEVDARMGMYGVAATQEWGTPRMPAAAIFQTLLDQAPIVVYDYDEEGRRHLNPEETAAAAEKGRLLSGAFEEWVWAEPERAQRLLAEYNKRFNSVVLRDYAAEGRQLSLPGLVQFTPHAHQLAAVARMTTEPSVGLFHEVGAGKTAAMVMGTMELKRLERINKPLVVVPNHMLEQFAREWLELYPAAKILAAGTEDLQRDARRRFIAKAAGNAWDGIIMTQSAFKSIGLTPENETAFQEREIAEARVALGRVEDGEKGRRIKDLEKGLTRIEERLKAKRDREFDPTLTFESMGVDYLVVDELHMYKNLRVISRITEANREGSDMALDLYAKIRYLRDSLGTERVITGATATPVANSVSEMYVMQRYLGERTLDRAGITDFDTWAATFGETVDGWEQTVSGGFKLTHRFAKFQNVPELRQMFHEFADVKSAEDLNLPRPDITPRRVDGARAPETLLVPSTPELEAWLEEAADRAANMSGRPEKGGDNMLKLSTEGRKVALDFRLLDPAQGPIPGKIDATADLLHEVWTQTKDNVYLDAGGQESPRLGGLQIVFCDYGTPSSEPDRFSVYDALRDALVDRGLPRDRVRFIHEAKSDVEKARLFQECRDGEVSVIVGSTSKMGVGTNIQARAVHLVNMDVPWRPADVQQRLGRAQRQGNQNAEIRVTNVITEKSFDTFMWQTVERKGKFVDQILGRGGDATSAERTAEGDLGSLTISAGEAKALASGNPLLLEFMKAETEVKNLQRLERAHRRSQRQLTDQVAHARETIASGAERVPRLQEAAARTIDTAGDAFTMDVVTRTGRMATYTSRAEASSALQYAAARLPQSYRSTDEPTTVARLGGHEIAALSHHVPGKGWETVYQLVDAPEIAAHALMTDPAIGVVRRLEHAVSVSLPSRIPMVEQSVEQAHATIRKAEPLLGHPFPRAAELGKAEDQFALVTAMMAAVSGQDQAVPPTPEEAQRQIDVLRRQLQSSSVSEEVTSRAEATIAHLEKIAAAADQPDRAAQQSASGDWRSNIRASAQRREPRSASDRTREEDHHTR